MALFHSKEPHQPQQHTGETGLHFRAETDQTRPPKWTAPQAELDHLHQIRHSAALEQPAGGAFPSAVQFTQL